MAINEIIGQIATIIGEVSGISSDNVHEYIRYVYTPKKFLDLFKQFETNKINAWQITRKSSLEQRESLSNNSGQDLQIHNILIIGWYSVKDLDNSSAEFQNLIEGVCAGLREKPTLNGYAFMSDPPQVIDVTFDTEGKILVHRCVISLKVTEYIDFQVS